MRPAVFPAHDLPSVSSAAPEGVSDTWLILEAQCNLVGVGLPEPVQVMPRCLRGQEATSIPG